MRTTDGNGGSASLNVPTPTASDAVWFDRDYSRRGIVGNHNLGLVDWARLLPTPHGWLGRRPENATADPERMASRRHEGIRGKRSLTIPEAIASIGDLTSPPSEGGSE